MSVLLELNNYAVKRGNHFALEGLNWSVESGQHWCILGPNGSGKTSLLSSISGYSPPSAGELRLFGELYGEAEWQDIRRALGVVSTGLHPYIEEQEKAEDLVVTGKESWLTNWGPIKKADRLAARRLMQQLGCEHIRLCEWSTLSQGERQKVLIARCMMAKVKLLFFDEPCSGLDPIARHQFLQSVERIAQGHGPAQVMVTHHVDEIVPSCTHVLLLGKQCVVAQGPKKSVLTNQLLSQAFGHDVTIRMRSGYYQLNVQD